MKFVSIVIAAAALAAASAPAAAHHQKFSGGKHHKAHAVHYGGKHGLGYWRKGPETGYGYRFSSYKGDPFGADDYYDGGQCHYLHKRNFCYTTREFNGFR